MLSRLRILSSHMGEMAVVTPKSLLLPRMETDRKPDGTDVQVVAGGWEV
jgi:hypothetical protein